MADDANRFTLEQLKRNAMQHRHFAIARSQIGDLEHDSIRRGALAAAFRAGIHIVGFANAHARLPR